MTPASPRVLIVEDEGIVRKPIVRLLRRHGYHVLAAASAEEALEIEAAHKGAIDLLFTDVVMPGRNGPELARILSNRRPGVKVVFCSGYTRDAFEGEGIPAGAGFIAKPHSFDELMRLLRDKLDAD